VAIQQISLGASLAYCHHITVSVSFGKGLRVKWIDLDAVLRMQNFRWW